MESSESATASVYYAVDTPSGVRLAREFRNVDAADGTIVGAARAMLGSPRDPDYRSLWKSTADVRAVRVVDNLIEVDVSGDAANVFAPGADGELAIQQLVYTVTGAAVMAGDASGPLPVRILLDGAPVDTLGSGDQLVDVSRPHSRDEQTSVRLLVQINDPAEGATLDRSVVVSGEAAAFEANVVWELRREDGTLVDSGFATAERCCEFSPFRFDLDLAPGRYEVTVVAGDPSDGEGPPPMRDTKTFTVE